MARLAAIQKGLYYPTPDRVVDMLAEMIDIQVFYGRVLDICAGTGVAGRLARRWGLESYGVELHRGRAHACQNVLDHVLHGSYHQLDATPESFSVLFLNPPYDDGENGRQEIEFLREANKYLAPGGLLVFIPPTKILQHHQLHHALRDYNEIAVHRFPDPEFDAFKQVVVLGKKAKPDAYATHFRHTYIPEGPYPILGENRYDAGTLPDVPGEIQFKIQGTNPYALAPSPTGGCYRLPQWKALTGQSDLYAFEQPLMTPRSGHVAMLLAAGSLNGTEIPGGFVVKGSSEKQVTEIKDEDAKIEIKREKIVSRLSVLDLNTATLKDWRTDESPDETRAWFGQHGPTLAQAVKRDHVPIYNGDLTGVDFSAVQAPGVFAGDVKPRLLDMQKKAAVAITKCWKKSKSAVVSGEMGVGKTTIAVVASTLAGHHKTVVIVPTHLVRKWTREAAAITKNPHVARAVKCFADVDAFFADPRAKFLILSKEKAKLGARWGPAVNKRRVRVARQVVDEDALLRRNRTGSWSERYAPPPTKTVYEFEDALTCPSCGDAILTDLEVAATWSWLEKTKRKCKTCSSPLWQARAISDTGTKRWPVAKYIRERFAGQYSLVMDEAHQYAGATSDQSRAVQLLCSGARRILAMTGTLYGGRASSIFHLLYKIDARFRSLYDYTDSPKFVSDHGLFEEVHKLEEVTSHYGNRRNNSGGRIREIPGVHPAMINLLLSYTVFVKLIDLGHNLPPFTETVELVDHDPEVLASANAMAAEAKNVLRKCPKILGQYLMACLGYPDCPEHAESIVGEVDGVEMEVASAPAFQSKTGWGKDHRVVHLARQEKAKGLKVLVFFTQTGKRTPIPRVKAQLERAGLRVVVLDGSIASDKREEWVLAQTDFDVMLTNGRLVETGLDLLFATTIIQYGTEYSIPTLRQSTRRSWRLGQTLAVKVIYLAYRNTMQEIAMMLIARKMRAAELVDGDDLGGLAQHDEEGNDFLLELARDAANPRRFATTQNPFVPGRGRVIRKKTLESFA